jgi:hypothetical protein
MQAAGDTRWRLLAGLIVLAMIVGLGSQLMRTQDAKADAVITCGTADTDPPSGAIPATLPIGATIYCQATTALAPATVAWSNIGTAPVTVGNANTLTTVGPAPSTNASFTVTGPGTVTIALDYTDANGAHPNTQTGQQFVVNATFIGVTGTADPNPALINTESTVTFTLPAGITYCSDASAAGANPRVFGPTDQTIAGATEVLTTPSVAANNVEGTHTVTITSATAGDATVTLSTHIAGSAAGAGCTDTVVTVTFSTVAGLLGDSALRHYDVDAGSEDAADGGNGLLLGNNGIVDLAADCPGVFAPNTDSDCDLIEDDDEAIGSLHTVCIVETDLTFTADAGFIEWVVEDTELNPSVSSFQEISGDALPVPITDIQPDAPCFQWASAAVGDQEVTAIYDPDGDDIGEEGVEIRFDGPAGDQPLIKEWNSIDVTRIVAVTGTLTPGTYTVDGTVGVDGIADNTGELDQWDTGGGALATDCERERTAGATAWCGLRANQDGTTRSVPGFLTFEGTVSAPSQAFIEYAFGSHTSHFNGPVDGVEQTFTVFGDCGSAYVEDPETGDVIHIIADSDVDSVTVLSSNYGVGFVINAFSEGPGDFECGPGDEVSVLIESEQDLNLTSAIDDAPDEIVTVNFFAQQVAKQPLLAWAGQRIVLPHRWDDGTGACVFDIGGPIEGPGQNQVFSLGVFARYEIERGDGAFVPTFLLGNPEGDDVFHASLGLSDSEDPCISFAVYEQEFQGQVDIKATLEICTLFEIPLGQILPTVTDEDCLATGFVHNFLVYYMEFEDITLGIVQGARAYHNNGPFDAAGNAWETTTDTTSQTANVSADVLIRARVRGWFKTDSLDTSGTNRPALDGKPAGRHVMPDDWLLLAGGATANLFRPNYDTMLTPGGAYSCADSITCASSTVFGAAVGSVSNSPVVGPFSLLDPGPGNNSFEFAGRETWLPDGQINLWDAPMPPALVTFSYVGEFAATTATSSGFLKDVSKFDIYGSNPYYFQAIPESPIINLLGNQNYLWDTWDDDGPYPFWDSVLDNRLPASAVSSAHINSSTLQAIKNYVNGLADDENLDPDPARIKNVYSDNHGEAMVYANGDFRLTFAECANNVIGGGKHCDVGDNVGTSSIFAVADYPDFKKKPQIASTPVNITWEWGGYKEVTIEDGETDQFKYVVFHALDRDGFCSVPLDQEFQPDVPGIRSEVTGGVIVGGDGRGEIKAVWLSGTQATFVNTGVPALLPRTILLHPVLSSLDEQQTILDLPSNVDPVESVDFVVDAGDGIILDTSAGTGVIDPTRRFAEGLPTFSTAQNTTIKEFPSLSGGDECQAWIRVSNSLLTVLDVIVVAADDEGDIGFDVIVDFQATFSYTLSFRWSLITWVGPDNIPVADALAGTGANEDGNDITDQVTAVYGWDEAAQEWLGYFPSGVDVPGANDLTALENGEAYWIAIVGPGSVTWTVATDVG